MTAGLWPNGPGDSTSIVRKTEYVVTVYVCNCFVGYVWPRTSPGAEPRAVNRHRAGEARPRGRRAGVDGGARAAHERQTSEGVRRASVPGRSREDVRGEKGTGASLGSEEA